ncbi:hypothetical protein SAMN02745857_03078 [Andreprevotia lacus DSM 23236]|jgi:hypothetical protein|uniref:ATP-grasp domain-containing protein n=1 Tax=Andreprevotia lacus DSM 23236 TaxID=1121001 RepID=A0A1W1XW13_9NEIS|nr:ATP-grasp domain-containing protein [Andreprevotia lacus]SMC28045.1 hypothetical protein SAMN02745857_03078 [Andreprevotia lacus DSM 23236]
MDIASIENKLVVASSPVGVGSYDFNFELHFQCGHPYTFDEEWPCVLRIGGIADYDGMYAEMLEMGLRPVNSPQQHRLASELEAWYPQIADLTPRSEVFEALPDVGEIERRFSWPVFIKGSRQTSKHNPELAVVRDADHYGAVKTQYRNDPILHWQSPVVREFVPLMPIEGEVVGKVRPSMEFRSFWWRCRCVGWGPYWFQVPTYACPDIADGLAIAQTAASRLNVPFLVIDLAKTLDGRWIIIECNDAQESGYTGVVPQLMWRSVLAGNVC